MSHTHNFRQKLFYSLLLAGLLIIVFIIFSPVNRCQWKSDRKAVPEPPLITIDNNIALSYDISDPAMKSALNFTTLLLNSNNRNHSYVHQSWKSNNLPARFMRWFATWETCFPHYQHLLWTDNDNLHLVKQMQPEFLDQYNNYSKNIQRADSVRYLYLYHFGGIYSDLDNECLRSFQHLIENSKCGVILGSMRYAGKQKYIQNSFMYSRPKHPIWQYVLKALVENRHKTGSNDQDTVDVTTGPKMLMEVVSKYGKLFANTDQPGPICVFPGHFFNPYSWNMDKNGPCKDLNKMSEKDLALCKIKHKTAYVIQYHTQSWFSGKV